MFFPSGAIVVSHTVSVCFIEVKFLRGFTFPPHPVFLQELASVGTEGRTGYLTVLGNVKHKMVCSPDFEALLENSV